VFTSDVRHDGLGRFERVSAPSKALAEKRASALTKLWNEQFARRQAILHKAGKDGVETLKKLEADERSEDAERAAHALTSILLDALRADPAPDWTPLYDRAEFVEAAPAEPVLPQQDPEPKKSNFPRAQLTLLTLLNPRAMRRRKEAALTKYQGAYEGWEYLKRWRQGEHDKAMRQFRLAQDDWEARRSVFLDLQQRANARLDVLREGYVRGESDAVTGHCDLALLSLDRPQGFPCFWSARVADGTLQLDYDLPSMAAVPVVKAVKYVAARDAFETVVHSERERERMYGEAVFQTCLAVLHRLFAADTAGAVRNIAFNGWVNYVDGTGVHPGRACILSVTADKRALAAIDLAGADPQGCFRALNGTMSAKLEALAARVAV
jgi:restriction system protein